MDNAKDLTVYLDETWTGETARAQPNEGVIAALACRGQPTMNCRDMFPFRWRWCRA